MNKKELAPGQNPMCDFFQAPLRAITKVLPGRPHGGKLPSPHQTWCTTSEVYSQKAVAIKNSGPPGLQCPHVYLYYKPHCPLLEVSLLKAFGQSLSQASLLTPSHGGKVVSLKDIIFYSNSVLNNFPLLALPLPPAPWAEVHKMGGGFFFFPGLLHQGFSSSAQILGTSLALFHGEKWNGGGGAFFSQASYTTIVIKGLTVPSILTCCFNQLLQPDRKSVV